MSISIPQINALVAEEFGLTVEQVEGRQCRRKIALARHTAIFVMATKTHFSLSEIGRGFGGRDQSSILYALNKIEDLIKNDSNFAQRIDRLFRHLDALRRINP